MSPTEKKSLLSFSELVSAVKGTEISENPPELFSFINVCTDSRAVSASSLFVPLIGKEKDGHTYVPEALEKGASAVFLNRSEYEKNADVYKKLLKKRKSFFIFLVDNTLRALQMLAARYVEKFPNLIKICVTGSSGKSTTKEMLVSVLSQKYDVVYSKGNFNSETGLPLSVFDIRENHEVGVFEMGMNRAHEIEEISSVLKANYGVITNIGSAHIGCLGSRKAIAEEKRHAFDFIDERGAAFIPYEDDFKDFLSEKIRGKTIYFGPSVPTSVSGVEFVRDSGIFGTEFRVDGIDVRLGVPGLYNYSNALSVVALSRELGLSAENIKAGLESFCPLGGRMELFSIAAKNGAKFTLVKDSYNANPESMKSVLDFMGTLKIEGKKMYVLGDMLELGKEAENEHEKIGKTVAEKKPDFVVFVGEKMENAYRAALSLGFSDAFFVLSHDDEAMGKIAFEILERLSENDIVLLKASRGIALERIVPLIQENGSSGNEKFIRGKKYAFENGSFEKKESAGGKI
ncbi:MAG: UDP-N-acetylmuramoyl-tripeptide--D-alanyl-D-alanine ligase [Treponema sp.]